MQNQTELPFEGFKQFVATPLEQSDPISFERIKTIFLEMPQNPSDPFRLLIQRLTGKSFSGKEARDHWQRIILHKEDMQAKLGRTVGIIVSSLDYFDSINGSKPSLSRLSTLNALQPLSAGINREEWINRVYAPGYHIEKLKEEMLRAKRYKHALSLLLLDVDNFHTVNQEFSYKIGDEILTVIVKIIKKTIRAVDIVSRYSGDRFLIILPYTNKREASELADRLRTIIAERTKRITGLTKGVTVTLCVSQSSKDSNSPELLKFLENAMVDGKKKARNSVHICETD